MVTVFLAELSNVFEIVGNKRVHHPALSRHTDSACAELEPQGE